MDRVDPRLIEAALAGRETGEPALDRAARVVADLRRVLLEEPPPEAASGHLDAMVSAASDGARGSTPVLSERRERRRRRFASLPLAAALLLGAGLAWGSVGLPEQASDAANETMDAAKERGAKPMAATDQDGTHGDEVSAVAKDDSLKGCEKGQAVSAVASSNGGRQGPGQDPCVKGDEGQAKAEQVSEKGKQRADEAKATTKTTDDVGGSPGHGPPDTAGPPDGTGPPADPGSQGRTP